MQNVRSCQFVSRQIHHARFIIRFSQTQVYKRVFDSAWAFHCQGASAAELKADAVRLGMKTLRLSGITRVLEGTTTSDEVARVSAADS